jgi:hypothetical protein
MQDGAIARAMLRANGAAGRATNDHKEESAMSAAVEKDGVSASDQAKNGRDTKGRFARGNPGGPGNPFTRQLAALRKELVNFFHEERIKELAFILFEKAARGDMAAMKLVFQYVIGKPQPAVDPDRVDVDEWQKMQERSRPPAEMSQVTNGMPVDKVCELTKIAWPCTFATNFAAPFRAGLQALDERDAQRAAKGKRPSRNGSNGQGHGVVPMTNGPNGPLPDWWDEMMHEVLAESRMREPDRKDRRAKKRRQRAGCR